MSYVYFNPNPKGKMVGDCVIRALSKILGYDWDRCYAEIVAEGFMLCDMPSSNYVWGSYLKHKGFVRMNLPDTCPECYTLEKFCADHPRGEFIVATGTHVIAVVNSNVYDSWNSLDEIVTYYWRKGDDDNG